jgi:hypothetical protein
MGITTLKADRNILKANRATTLRYAFHGARKARIYEKIYGKTMQPLTVAANGSGTGKIKIAPDQLSIYVFELTDGRETQRRLK